MKSNFLTAILLVISILISLTNFYSFSYILVVLLASKSMGSFFIFRTAIQRFILALSAFLAVIPIIGLICWILDTDMLPLYNVFGFGFVYFLLSRKRQKDSSRPPIGNKVDIVAGAVALIPLIIILISYGLSSNRSAALFQLASEGWDNGSHILMLEDVSTHNGYVYGPYDELKNTIIQKTNAYPQAWHLATADFVNGFGGNKFDPHKPIATIAAYMVASIGWMMLACYLFVICALRLYERITKKEIKYVGEITPIVAMSLVIQMIVAYGSLASGFTNYLGSITYLLFLTAMVIEIFENRDRDYYIFAVLFGTVSVLTWFLTFPPTALTILILLLLRSNTIRSSLLINVRDWKLTTITLIGLSAMILQIYIFQKFSVVGGSDQLNAGVKIDAFDVVAGVFPVSQIFYTLIVGSCLVYCFIKKPKKSIQLSILTIFMPWLLMVLGLFLYQNITVGYNSYYLSKVFGLSLVVAGVIFSVLFAIWINKNIQTKRSNIIIPSLSILFVGLLIIGTGQSTYGLNKLFQENARTTYGSAVKISAFLKKAKRNKDYIVVLRDNPYYDGSNEDNHGKLELRVTHQKLNCVYTITNGITPQEKIRRLSSCADKLAKQNKIITVITSDKTKGEIKALNKSNITIWNVPSKKN